jgi:hypothetical protein
MAAIAATRGPAGGRRKSRPPQAWCDSRARCSSGRAVPTEWVRQDRAAARRTVPSTLRSGARRGSR